MALDAIAELDERVSVLVVQAPGDDVDAIVLADADAPPQGLHHRMSSSTAPGARALKPIHRPQRIISASDAFQQQQQQQRQLVSPPAPTFSARTPPSSATATFRLSPPTMVVAQGRPPAPSHNPSPSYAPLARSGAQEAAPNSETVANPYYTPATSGYYDTPPPIPPIHIAHPDLRLVAASPPELSASASSSSSSSGPSTPPSFGEPSSPTISAHSHEHRSTTSLNHGHLKNPSVGSLSYASVPDSQRSPPRGSPPARTSRASEAAGPAPFHAPPPSMPDTSSLVSGAMPVVTSGYRRPDARAVPVWKPRDPGPSQSSRADPSASRTAEPFARNRHLDHVRSQYTHSVASGSASGFEVLSRPSRTVASSSRHLAPPKTNTAPSMLSNHTANASNTDKIDQLDDTDPLGYAWHHSSPYEAVGLNIGKGPGSHARTRSEAASALNAPPSIPIVRSHRVSPSTHAQEVITPIDPRPPPSAAMFPSTSNVNYIHPEDAHAHREGEFDVYDELEPEPMLRVPPPGRSMASYEERHTVREHDFAPGAGQAPQHAPILPSGPMGSYKPSAHAMRSPPPSAPSVRSIGGESGYSTPVTFREGGAYASSVRSRATSASGRPPPSHRPRKLVMPTPLQGHLQPLQVIPPPSSAQTPLARSSDSVRTRSSGETSRAAYVPMMHDRGHNLLRKQRDSDHDHGSFAEPEPPVVVQDAGSRSASRERGFLRKSAASRDASPAPPGAATTGSFTSWFVTPKTKEVEQITTTTTTTATKAAAGGKKKLSKRR